MANFTITINDAVFGQFNGTFPAEDQFQAEKDAKEFYAIQLYTYPENVNITNVSVL